MEARRGTFAEDPTHVTFSPWRHGGWYTSTRIPTKGGGTASGTVSRNYPDGRWRVVDDPRGYDPKGCWSYSTRTEAALAEKVLVLSGMYGPVEA